MKSVPALRWSSLWGWGGSVQKFDCSLVSDCILQDRIRVVVVYFFIDTSKGWAPKNRVKKIATQNSSEYFRTSERQLAQRMTSSYQSTYCTRELSLNHSCLAHGGDLQRRRRADGVDPPKFMHALPSPTTTAADDAPPRTPPEDERAPVPSEKSSEGDIMVEDVGLLRNRLL